MFFKVKTNEKLITIKTSFIFIMWYINFAFIATLILFFFIYFLKHWKSNALWIFLQSLHHHFNAFFSKKIFYESMFLRAMYITLFVFINIHSMIMFLTFRALLYFAVSFVIFHRFYVWFYDYFQLNQFIRNFCVAYLYYH